MLEKEYYAIKMNNGNYLANGWIDILGEDETYLSDEELTPAYANDILHDNLEEVKLALEEFKNASKHELHTEQQPVEIVKVKFCIETTSVEFI